MNRRLLFALPSVLLVGAALHARAAPIADTQVTIDNFMFNPTTITVAVGGKVTWTNRDDTPHTVTDADHPREVRSPALDTGDTYSRVFAAPGTYRYFCSLHPHMQGTVVVK